MKIKVSSKKILNACLVAWTTMQFPGAFCSSPKAVRVDEYSKLSCEATKLIARNDCKAAIPFLQKAIVIAKAKYPHGEQTLNSLLILAHCQIQLKAYEQAKAILNEVETAASNRGLNTNPALLIRLQRRKVDLYTAMEQAENAALAQSKLCDLYQQSIGNMNAESLDEHVTLARLELAADNVKRAYSVGRETEHRMKRFHLAEDSQMWLHTYVILGIAAIRNADFRNASKFLDAGLARVGPSEGDFEAHYLTLLAICARADKDVAAEQNALAKLVKTHSESHIRLWFERSNSECKTNFAFRY